MRRFQQTTIVFGWLLSGVINAAPPLPLEKPITAPVPLNKPSKAATPMVALDPVVQPVFPKSKPDATPAIPIATQPTPKSKPPPALASIELACERISRKLSSVAYQECMQLRLVVTEGRSVNGFPLLKLNVNANAPNAKARVLIVGGTHGDEYTSISVVFKWLSLLTETPDTTFDWLIVPVLNPDGLLQAQSSRTNASGVDLNRNLPTANWNTESYDYWVKRTSKNPRRFPGPHALSEPENKWLVALIEQFRPDVIIATHAPHGIVDFDGPPHGPKTLGKLSQRLLGTFPGSLGNYAGLGLGIPVVTVEFSSAGIMPSRRDIKQMWLDLHDWLSVRFDETQADEDQLRADAGQVYTR